jgi:hypothetical protein
MKYSTVKPLGKDPPNCSCSETRPQIQAMAPTSARVSEWGSIHAWLVHGRSLTAARGNQPPVTTLDIPHCPLVLPALHIQTTAAAAAAADITSMKATHKRNQHHKKLTGSSKKSTTTTSPFVPRPNSLPTITRPISTVCASAFIPSVFVGTHPSGPSPRYQVFVEKKKKRKKNKLLLLPVNPHKIRCPSQFSQRRGNHPDENADEPVAIIEESRCDLSLVFVSPTICLAKARKESNHVIGGEEGHENAEKKSRQGSVDTIAVFARGRRQVVGQGAPFLCIAASSPKLNSGWQFFLVRWRCQTPAGPSRVCTMLRNLCLPACGYR